MGLSLALSVTSKALRVVLEMTQIVKMIMNHRPVIRIDSDRCRIASAVLIVMGA